jgi:hypothetical protein
MTEFSTQIDDVELSRCARAGQRMRAVIPLFDLT